MIKCLTSLTTGLAILLNSDNNVYKVSKNISNKNKFYQEILLTSEFRIKVFEKVGSLTNLNESWIIGHTSKFLLDFSTKVNPKQIYD